MNKAKQKRNNEYYLERLRSEHPAVYSDFKSGRFKNLSEALIEAGIRKKRTGLDTLKSAWKKASTAERDAFKAFIGCVTPPVACTPVATHVPVKSSSPSPSKQHLPPALKAAILEIMNRRRLKLGGRHA